MRLLLSAGKFDLSNSDDTELLDLSSDLSSASSCANNPAVLHGTYSLLYPVAVVADNGNPMVCGGQIHFQG